MNIGKAFKSNYLKAADLDGEEVIVTIRGDVQMEKIQDDEKPVLYFDEFETGLVLNKTNANAIAQVTQSHETKDWDGKKIALYPATVDFQGKAVEAIRVKLRTPRAQAQAAPNAATSRRPRPIDDGDDLPI